MRRRILVVDDDEAIVEVLTAVLDLDEFEVTATHDGQTALDLARRHPPDAVLLDVMMPGLDGYAVCRQLKTDPATADIPVVLLTARDLDEDRSAGLAAGADAYLTKPFSPLQLIDQLTALVGEGRR